MTQFIVMGYPAYAYTGGRHLDATLPAVAFIHGVQAMLGTRRVPLVPTGSPTPPPDR